MALKLFCMAASMRLECFNWSKSNIQFLICGVADMRYSRKYYEEKRFTRLDIYGRAYIHTDVILSRPQRNPPRSCPNNSLRMQHFMKTWWSCWVLPMKAYEPTCETNNSIYSPRASVNRRYQGVLYSPHSSTLTDFLKRNCLLRRQVRCDDSIRCRLQEQLRPVSAHL